MNGSSHKLKQNCNISLSIPGNKMCNMQTKKLLGLYIDNTLSWKPHIIQYVLKWLPNFFFLNFFKPSGPNT